MIVIRSDEEIDALENESVEHTNFGTKFRGMSYEDGIIAALRWLREEDAPQPMSD